MKDLTILLENRPGELARMGEALGRAGVSIEGGGAWMAGEQGIAANRRMQAEYDRTTRHGATQVEQAARLATP